MPRILFVGMADSIHTARWINQLNGENWERYLFPSEPAPPHPDLHNMTYFNNSPLGRRINKALYYKQWTSYYFALEYLVGAWRWLHTSAPLHSLMPITYRAKALARAIQQTQPDIVHSLEIQHAGYLTLEAKRLLKKKFPKWILTNWGSDIYLFGRLSRHLERIRETLENCDFYSCECERDVKLAQELGLKGQVLPVVPNTGGFDLKHTKTLRQTGPTSLRRTILLKGYQHWAGRALVGLRALARCTDLLKAGGYQIAIYSASPEVQIAAELFEQETGIVTELIPQGTHDNMLHWYGKARLYIGLSISDAISTSLLEAMVMGAFPIQSCTACADEWIEDGKTGFIVPPEDTDIIEKFIRRALLDDKLVNRATEVNAQTARERLDQEIIRQKVTAFYDQVMNTPITRK